VKVAVGELAGGFHPVEEMEVKSCPGAAVMRSGMMRNS
jgi:hypothetical protein